MTIKVIGAGFGRTGTSSLKAALEVLGFGKCYHMVEVFAHPEHARVWKRAAAGQPVDWDQLFQDYQATVDWPGCAFYRELIDRYPEAKVLLSVRDPDAWYESARNTIYRSRHVFPTSIIRHLLPRLRAVSSMNDVLIWNGTFHGRFEDRPYAIEVFERHNAEVQRVVAPERLLVYNVKQGWEPLCRFLGVPVPRDTPFPRLNDREEFQKMIHRRARLSLVMLGALIGGIGLAGGLAGRWLRPTRRGGS